MLPIVFCFLTLQRISSDLHLPHSPVILYLIPTVRVAHGRKGSAGSDRLDDLSSWEGVDLILAPVVATTGKLSA